MRSCLGLAAGFVFAVMASSSVQAQVQAAACGDLRKLTGLDMQSLPDGRVTLGVTVVDRPSQLLLDTGGDFRALTPEVVEALGVKPVTGGDLVKDVPGHASTPNVVVPSITLGGVKVPDAAFLVLPRPDLRVPKDAKVDGRLTLDMLPGLDFDLDFAANQMGLFLQDHCEGKVVYWPNTGVTILPFSFDTAFRINFPVSLDGQPMTAMLDTSVADTTLDLDVAKEIGLQVAIDGAKRIGTDSNGKEVYQRRFNLLSFDAIGVSNPQINFVVSKGPAKPGARPRGGAPLVIGINSLKKLHIYFAVGEQRMYITAGAPVSATPAPAQ